MGNKPSRSNRLVIKNSRGGTVNIYPGCCCTKSEQHQIEQYQSNRQLSKLSDSEQRYGKIRKKTSFCRRIKSKTNCNDIGIHVSDETEDKEPIQIDEFIQQNSSSESEQFITPNTNEFSNFEAVPSETTDCRNITSSKSSGDSGFVESYYNSFKNQTNVQSVRSNAHNGKDETEIGRIQQSINESCELNTQTNLDTTLSNDGYDCATERKHLAHNSECARLSDTESNSKPKKQIMSVSSFDSSCDNEDTLKNLNLRCESDSEELTFLKLPGPSIKQECTEIKSIFSPQMLHLVNIDQVPSSGYPLESDCDYFLTHDLSSEFSEKKSKSSNTVEKDLSSCSKITDDKDNTFEHVLHVSSNEFKIGKEIVNVGVEHVPETITKHCDKERISADEDTYLQNSSVHDKTKNYCDNPSESIDRTNLSDYEDDLSGEICQSNVICPENKIQNLNADVGDLHQKQVYDGDIKVVNNESNTLVIENKIEVNNGNSVMVENKGKVNAGKDVLIENKCDVNNGDIVMAKIESEVNDDQNLLIEENKSKVNAGNNLWMENNEKNNGHISVMENKSEEINTVYSDVSRDSGCYTLSMNKGSDKCQEDNLKVPTCHDSLSLKKSTSDFMKFEHSDKFNIINKYYFGSPQFDNLIVTSFRCQNLLAIAIDEQDASNTSFIRASECGILQEVTLSQYENRETETSASETCNFNKRKDAGIERKRNFYSESDISDKRHEAYHLNCSNDGFWYVYGAQDFPFYRKSQRRHDICNEYHGTEMNYTHLSYGAKAMSESNLPSLEDKLTFCSKNTLMQGYNFASVLPIHDDKRIDNLNAFRKEQPNSDRYEDEKKGNEDINFGHFSKSVSPTNIDSRIRPKRLKKKRKITPHRETSMTSLLGIQTSLGSFHHSKKRSYYSQYKRKSKTSRTRKFSKHQKSKTIHNELFSTFFDSGLGSSRSIKSNSLIYMMKQESYKSKSKFSFSPKRSLERLRIQQNMKSITKYERYMKNFFRNRGRLLAKSVARHLIGRPSSNGTIGVLDRYFHRVSNGPPLTTQERMQYEWLRLSTFHNYEGNGNAIVLARNGFYHDHTEGPTSTRCFLCEARNSNWEMFANVSSEHRRQSPNCPFHENSGQESVNVSITYEDNVTGSSAAPPTTTSGSTPTVTVTSSASSVATAAVNEALRSLQIGQASSHGAESISQQPTEDRESDRSMLALSQPRTLRALGRTGHSYASIMAPTRNNVASGARSNVGVDPGRDVSRSTSSQIPGIRPSSILGGPVGAGAFAGLNSSGLTPVSRAKENLEQSNVPTPAVEAATGARQSNPAPGAGGRTDPNITVVVDNPKHPDYVNVESRVNTYQGWPDYLDQTPRQMSEAGFFFVGVADFTRCFCCGGGLRNWEPGDDPVLEHTRWFPRCEYINKLKGERYVAAVQRRHEQHMAEQQRQQTELAQRRDESRNDPDPLTIEAAIQLQDMGYSAERTRQAVIAVRQQTGQSIPTTEQVLTWLLDNEERENGSGMTTEFGVRPQPSETSAVATTVVGTSVPSSTISTPTTIVGTSIPTSIVNTGFGIPTTIVGTSVPTSIVGTSIPSSILNAGSSFESSSTFYTGFNAPSTLVESVSIIGTPNVHTISSTSSSTSQVGAGTTTSTVSSTSTSATAKVQPSVSSASAEGVTEGSSSATGSENNSGSHEAKGSNTEKQSAASGDSDESKQTAKDPSSNEPSNKSNKKKYGKKKAKMKPNSDTAGATGGDVDAQSLKAENEKLKEMQTCKICMERPVNTTLLPCGHLVCCETCAGRLQRCPICRKRIKGTVKTFMS